MPTITNISMTADLNCKLNLRHVTMNSSNCIYNRKHFDQVIIRLRNPYVTVLLYTSGKMVSRAMSFKSGRIGLRRVGRMVQKIGYNVKISNIQITNMAATYDLMTYIPLGPFSIFLGIGASYEHEHYPNLIYKANKKSITIEPKGKIILTGCKTFKE